MSQTPEFNYKTLCSASKGLQQSLANKSGWNSALSWRLLAPSAFLNIESGRYNGSERINCKDYTGWRPQSIQIQTTFNLSHTSLIFLPWHRTTFDPFCGRFRGHLKLLCESFSVQVLMLHLLYMENMSSHLITWIFSVLHICKLYSVFSS